MPAAKLTISVPASLAAELKAYDLSPSAICQPALRAAVDKAEGDARRIVVETTGGYEAFYGRWVIDPDSEDANTAQAFDENGVQIYPPDERWGVALTDHGRIVVYWRNAKLLRRVDGGLAAAAIPDDVRERATEPARVAAEQEVITMHEDW